MTMYVYNFYAQNCLNLHLCISIILTKYTEKCYQTGKVPVYQYHTGKVPVCQYHTDKVPVYQYHTDKVPVYQYHTDKVY